MKDTWQNVALGEVLTHYQEYIDAPEAKIYPKLSVKLYGKGVVLDNPADGTGLKMKRHQLAKSGQVILSEIWGKKGAIGFVPPEGEGALCTSHFFLFDVNSDRLDPRWLQAIFRANFLESQLGAEAQGTTGYAAVRPKILLASEIPLPPLPEQRRIVARIEELAAKIEEARGLRKQAMEEAGGLATRVRVVTFESLSKEYPTEPLGNLIKLASGDGLTSSEMGDTDPYPVYGGGGYNGRYTRYMFEEPKIVIGRVGARCGCVFVTEPKAWVTDNALYVVSHSERLLPAFLVQGLTSLDMRQNANEAAQPVVSQKKINPLLIPVPPISIQKTIADKLAKLENQMVSLDKAQSETSTALDALLPSLLDRAFRGEL